MLLAQEKKKTLLVTEANEISLSEGSTLGAQSNIKWKRGNLIGEGAYAKVFQCMNVDNGELLAVKTYKFSEDPEKVQKEFISMRKEIRLLQDLEHPNIVKYF
jgi:serine/threonine protein kinase